MTQTEKNNENVTLEAERSRIYQGLKQIHHNIQADSSNRRQMEYRLAAEDILIQCMELLLGDEAWKYIKVNGKPDMEIRRMDWFK